MEFKIPKTYWGKVFNFIGILLAGFGRTILVSSDHSEGTCIIPQSS